MPEQMFGSVESYKQQKKYLDFLNKINNGLNGERKQKKNTTFQRRVFLFNREISIFKGKLQKCPEFDFDLSIYCGVSLLNKIIFNKVFTVLVSVSQTINDFYIL